MINPDLKAQIDTVGRELRRLRRILNREVAKVEALITRLEAQAMKRPNPTKAFRFTKGHPAKEIWPKPVLPTTDQMPILRRAAAGYIIVTLTEEGPIYRYEDGGKVGLKRTQTSPTTWDDGQREFDRMVKEGWLVPDTGDSLLPDGPPQIYRAVKVPKDDADTC